MFAAIITHRTPPSYAPAQDGAIEGPTLLKLADEVEAIYDKPNQASMLWDNEDSSPDPDDWGGRRRFELWNGDSFNQMPFISVDLVREYISHVADVPERDVQILRDGVPVLMSSSRLVEGDRSGAEFRTRRDATGATRAWFAHKLGVSIRTVQYWEDGRDRSAPPEAWVLVEQMEKWIEASVETSLTGLAAIQAEQGGAPEWVVLTRYRSDKQYARAELDPPFPALVHAQAIAKLREHLVALGYQVRISYPAEGNEPR